jgi:hypothetical protein
MPGRRKITGKVLGPVAAATRRTTFFDERVAQAPDPAAAVRVRGEHLAAVIRHAPPALVQALAEEALTTIGGLIAAIETKGSAA